MENYTKGSISNVSWRDMLAQDPYYGLTNSFQYSENINCDDELHGIKLSQRIIRDSESTLAYHELVSAGNYVYAIPTRNREGSGDEQKIKYFEYNDTGTPSPTWKPWKNTTAIGAPLNNLNIGRSIVFQDYLWTPVSNSTQTVFVRTNVDTHAQLDLGWTIYDHLEDSDESISSINTKSGTFLKSNITAILNYNNTRLVVGAGQELWVYYPELDMTGKQQTPTGGTTRTVDFGETGWKKVQEFENGCNIVGLTCDFYYLKVWVTDEGWNTKMYYYPGNNDLRNTFVYNLVDLTGTKVLHVYNINGVDYYTASLNGTEGYITFNKVLTVNGSQTPTQIFKQRGGLCQYDANQKAGYFVGPTCQDSAYQDGAFYIGDSFGAFKFAYVPNGIDTGYLKWKIRNTAQKTYGLCIAWNFLFVSDESGLRAMRLYDTGVDGYESKGILVSREFEGDYGGSVAKILDEIRCHFELNPLILDSKDAGSIDIYVSPNNKWKKADPESDSTGWHKVIHIDGLISNQNRATRYESTKALNNLDTGGKPAFEFDRETVTYCVVIKKGTNTSNGDDITQRTPVVREVNLRYHLKGKANDVYNIKN